MDRLVLGLQTTVIGMGVVFLALFILAKLMEVPKLLTRPKNGAVLAPPAAPEAVDGAGAVLPESERSADREELVAAIAGALASYLQRPVNTLRILAVNRADSPAVSASAWRTAGRQKLMESRLSLYNRK